MTSYPPRYHFTSLQEQIRTANQVRYNNMDEVDAYMQKPYHALRLSLSIQLVKNEIARAFSRIDPADIRILDVGSSTGKAALELAKAGYNVTASDIELLPLSAALEVGLHCVQFDASQSFPFADGSINIILMGELIEHIFDIGQLLLECNRVLCSNGILVITTPNLARLQDRFLFLFGHAPRQVNPLHKYLKLHIRPFSFSLLRNVLDTKGFKVNKLLSNYVTIDLAPGKYIQSRLLAQLFPTIGGTLIVSAQKMTNLCLEA